jgi:serine protease
VATKATTKTKKRERSAEKLASAAPFKWPRVVVRLKDDFDEGRERKELTEQYGLVAFHPVFIVARAAIARLQTVARERWRTKHEDRHDEDRRETRSARAPYPLPDFLQYYFLYLPPGREPADVVRELRKRDTVAFAYEDQPTMNASSSPSQLKCSQSSGHVDGERLGVNARFAWTYPGGKGEAQFFVDVEHGWTKEHSRLPGSKIELLVGESEFGERAHGTSVLGIVCGQHPGCEGLAPGVAYVGLASPAPDPAVPVSLPPALRYAAATAAEQNIYDAIAMGIDKLVECHESSPEDGYGVLLIEQQTAQGLPVETYMRTPFDPEPSAPEPSAPEGVQALIAFATQMFDITVVEAAGNAGRDLDSHPDAQVLKQHDSGAILVGSAKKARIGSSESGHHTRFNSSNFGPRVNCYAWGERVMTPAWRSGTGPPGVIDECDDLFGHTSAAAAIIAGAALIVQGIVAHLKKPPLDAYQLRTILANPASGTPSAGGHIGVMPDLGKIAPTL